MIAGLIASSCYALLAFRHLPFGKPITKVIHVLMHTASIVFVVLGLTAVIMSNNFKSDNNDDSYAPNLFTLHSFIGLGAIFLYIQNYVFGVLFYLFPIFTLDLKQLYMPNHKLFGMMALLISFAAVGSGLMEEFTSAGCSYSVTSPDNDPAASYHLLSGGCRNLNAVGIVCMLAVVSCVFAVIEIRV